MLAAMLATLFPALLAAVPAGAPVQRPHVALLPLPTPRCQEADDPATGNAASREALPPPEAPPVLPAMQLQKLERELAKLSSSKPAARQAAIEQVVAYGRGALPALVAQAATTSATKQAALGACLLALADLRDWDLVERSLESEEVALRRFAARKAGELPLPHLRAQLIERLRDADAEVRLEAAVAVTALGSDAALDALAEAYLPLAAVERQQDASPEQRAHAAEAALRLRTALAGLRDEGDLSPLVKRLKSDPAEVQADPEGAAAERRAAIALLAAVGGEDAIRGLGLALDDGHNLVQRDAINALRQLVEDAPPFTGGSIFEQISEIKRLKAVLAQRR